MKKTRNRLIQQAIAATCVIVLSGGLSRAAPSGEMSREQVTREQQSIRAETETLASRVDLVVDQLAENKLIGDDAASIARARSVLRGVSQEEMAEVIRLLATGSAGVEETRSLQQKAATKMRDLLLGYQFQQRVEQLRSEAQELARSQDSMANTVRSQSEEKQRGRNVDENWRKQTAQEQRELAKQADELKQELERLAEMAQGEVQQQLRAASREMDVDQVSQKLKQVAEAVGNNNYDQQPVRAKEAAASLTEVAKKLGGERQEQRELELAVGQLQKMAQAQRDVTEQTKKNNGPDEQAAQSELQGMAEQLQQKVPRESRLAEQLAGAAWGMDRARDQMKKGQTQDALRQQESAARHLDEAAKELARMLQDDKTADRLAGAKEIKKTTEEARKKLEEAKGKVDQELAQGGLNRSREAQPARDDASKQIREQADKLQEALRQASLEQPGVVDALRVARDRSHTAADTRKTDKSEDNDRLRAALDQAIASAKQAEEQMAREVASLEKVTNELATLDKAREGLEKAVQSQQQAAATPAPESAKQAQEQVTQQAAAAEQALKSVEKSDQARSSARSAQEQSKQARQAAETAKTNDQSREKLEQHQASTMGELAAALNQVDAMRAERQAQLGQQASDPSGEQSTPEATTQAHIEQAQQRLEQAAKALEENLPQTANESLQQAQQAMATAMSKASSQAQQAASGEIAKAMMEAAQAQAEAQAEAQAQAQAQAASPGDAKQPGPSSAKQNIAAAKESLGEALTAMASGSLKPGTGEQASEMANGKAGQPGSAMSRRQRAAMNRDMARSGKSIGPSLKPSSGNQVGEDGKDSIQGDALGSGEDRDVAGELAQDHASIVRLPERERAALRLGAGAGYPPEYAELVEEYLRSLSSGANGEPTSPAPKGN